MAARPPGRGGSDAPRLPPWVGPAAALVILVSMTLLLWWAQRAVEITRGAGHSGGGLSSTLLLTGGLVVSALTAGLLWVASLRLARDHAQTRRHLQALESLHATASAIVARVDAGAGALAELCEAARQLLGMTRAGITLLDPRSRRLELLAGSGDMPPNPPRFYRVDDIPVIGRCLETGQILLAEDVRRDPFPQNGALLEFFRVRSLILIPLSVRGEQIGLMTLSSSEPHRFDDVELRLAELLGVQGAVILANSRLYQGQQRAVRRYKALVDQRELLFSTNAAIYQTGDLEESLRRVAELAPLALQVDVCIVCLAASMPNNIRVVAVTLGVRTNFFTPGKKMFCPNSEAAFARADAVAIEDATENRGVQPFVEDFGGVASVLYVPLLSRAGGERIGMLVLVRRQKGAFSPDQLNMARLFSTRAAAAIENARLHQETRRALAEQKKLLIENAQLLEQTQRDADTKAMLLRELNHRVKNNLAGIVALLSIGRPDMPPPAKRWLDRVTDRVRVMAGAHQLFVGDADSVPLGTLAERMLSSLAVARPPGVAVQLDLGVRDVELRTEQAISLAMALHELCYNAIVHGLEGAGGTVTLRTRMAGEGRLAVHVIDDGRGMGHLNGFVNGAPAVGEAPDGGNGDNENGQGTGIGLELVRGLVTRELRGSFSLGERPGGGTVATVEFPLQPGTTERATS